MRRAAVLGALAMGAATLMLGDACAAPQRQRVRVVVAAEPWERLLYVGAGDRPEGIIADFVGRMNAVQDKFRFELSVLPRLRLNQHFIDRKADVYRLRTVAWTEPSLRLRATRTLVVAHDMYFAFKDNKWGGEAICDHIREASIAAVRGYHYRLFDNNPDPAHIAARFKVALLPSNESVMHFIGLGRADLGIAPEAILAAYLNDQALKEQFLVCKRPDSEVRLSNLVREEGPISAEQMNAVIDLLEKSGDVARLRAAMTIAR